MITIYWELGNFLCTLTHFKVLNSPQINIFYTVMIITFTLIGLFSITLF